MESDSPREATFRKIGRGWLESSDGYALRIGSRTGIDYRDDRRIDSEVMQWPEVLVYVGSIADTPERPRAEVIDRLRRAFEAMGFKLTIETAWID